MAYETPMVSVIVPMYNVEEYIGELLESVLAQTFQNFELIVVDNGSTDNSHGILQSYLPKFENRLKIIKFEKNSGGPSIPRNRGLELSRGKYVFFMDSDDALLQTGLEEMYTLAEEFQADVVYCDKCCRSTGKGQDFINNIKMTYPREFIEKPIFVPENDELRIRLWLRGIYQVPPWRDFVLRDFLIANNITFPAISREDELWAFEVLFTAKKILMVPNCCYIKRDFTGNNLTTKQRNFEKHIHCWLDLTICGLKVYDEIMGKISFFKKNRHTRNEILRAIINNDLRKSFDVPVKGFSLDDAFDAIKNEFKGDMGDNDVLIASLCVNNYLLFDSLMYSRQQLAQLTTPPPAEK